MMFVCFFGAFLEEIFPGVIILDDMRSEKPLEPHPRFFSGSINWLELVF